MTNAVERLHEADVEERKIQRRRWTTTAVLSIAALVSVVVLSFESQNKSGRIASLNRQAEELQASVYELEAQNVCRSRLAAEVDAAVGAALVLILNSDDAAQTPNLRQELTDATTALDEALEQRAKTNTLCRDVANR